MEIAPLHPEEKSRLLDLLQYEILDSEEEGVFDELTELASTICETPISLISLIDENRQWFKSRLGLEATETPRSQAFCSHAILGEGVFEVPNALKDQRFFDNPLVTNDPKIRFYAGSPLVSPNGLPLGTLCVIDREEKKLSPDQKRALEILSKQVVTQMELRKNYRQLKRLNESLKMARENADQANRSKSEFLASMSHEIRTPMNAIMGMAELLWDSPLTPEQQEYVQVFRSAGENLLSIINDILDISKVEAGKIELEIVNFNLLDLVEKTCEVMAVRAHEKGLELTCNVLAEVPIHLKGDPTRLGQILTNLLSNAIKFTDTGEIVTEITLERDSVRIETDMDTSGRAESGKKPNGNEIKVSVRDTGVGIPPDKHKAIFDLFSQADSSTTREYGGTGLGLTISRRLVEMMNGRIWVESIEGKGSTFYFTACLEKQDMPDIPVGQTLPDRIKGLNALVIDDNETNRMILRTILSQWGLHVTEAEDGQAGLEVVEKSVKSNQTYDLLLLDCRMPRMDGFDVAKRIKKIAGLKGAPIMMLTSDNRSGDIARANETGISRYMVKPVKKSDLKKAIIEVTTQSGIDREAVQVEKKTEDLESKFQGHILLVDDSADNRLLIQAYLKKTAHRLDIAENGQIAVERFASGAYDLILMDMEMPVMDGYTATQRIRELEKQQNIRETPIVALTAHALKEYEQKSLEAGCTAHLTKPIKKKKLIEAIENHLAKSHRGSE